MKTIIPFKNLFQTLIARSSTAGHRFRAAVALIGFLLALAGDSSAQSLTTLIPAGAEWACLDDGSDLGTAWRGLSFDDSNWPRGAAQLGYGDGDEATLVRQGDNQGNVFVTTYFRSAFVVANPAAVSNLVVQFKRDDGAIGYLNGVEVFRNNMPTGMITGFTYASAPVEGTNELLFATASIYPSLLKSGQNVLAVEVHQFQDTGNDLSFDLKLDAEILTPSAPPQISQQPTNQVTLLGGTASFTVVANGSEPLAYQWQRNGVPLAGGTTYSLTIPNVEPEDGGSYTVAIANAFGVTQSTPATLTVLIPPPVSVTGRVTDPAGQPVDGVTLVINGPTHQSVLSDPDGTYAFHGLRYGSSYLLTVGDTNLFATPAGMNLSPLINSTVANFTVATPYQAWQQTYWGANAPQGSSDPNADTDGDGKPNLIEFAMGSDPMTADTESGIGIRLIGTNGTAHPVISLKLNPQARDLLIGVEVTGNLTQSDWTTLCRRGAEAYEGEMGPSMWGASPQLSPDSPHVTGFEETLEGVDIHLSVAPGGKEACFVKWWAAAHPATTPGLVIASPSIERKNHTLLVGFNNFQRMPEIVRTGYDRSENPLGYLSDKVAARRFARRVIQGGYDIIALAEVWTDEAKNQLEHDLKACYPYYVKEVDPYLSDPPTTPKLQDSGLMLFSKLPFVPLSRLGGAVVSSVAFGNACSDEDCASNKGAGMVQVHDPLADRDYTVVFTHLNANGDEGDREAKKTQLDLIRQMLVWHYGEPPFPHSVLFLGDLNINGDLANDGRTIEWTGFMGTDDLLSSWWGHYFKDTWEAQSLHELVERGNRDRGLTSSVLSPDARYDYLLTHQGRANKFVVQHMALALNLRSPLSNPVTGTPPETTVAFGTAGNQDLSDHYGIVAYIHPDLDSMAPGTTPANAIRVPETPADPPNSSATIEGDVSEAGEMRWFLIPNPGTYSIGIVSDADFQFDVFTSLDLSQQAVDSGSLRLLHFDTPPYKVEGMTYVCPFSPLFIRVQHKDPQAIGHFRLVVREHKGTSKEDAIPLAPNAPFTLFDPTIVTSGSHERWYLIATDAAESGHAQTLRFEAEAIREGEPINYHMQVENVRGDVLWEWSVSTSYHGERWTGGDNLYLRVSPTPGAAEWPVKLRWSTDLTVILPARVPMARFGFTNTTTEPALVISVGTDENEGFWEDEENVQMTWVLSSNPAVMEYSLPLLADGAILSQLTPVGLAREIAPGQDAKVGHVFPTLCFVPEEYLEVQCIESDNKPTCGGCYSLLQGRVSPLDRDRFFHAAHPTCLYAQESPRSERYTLHQNIAHGIRWIEFGRP